jgi:hypothetical protein
MLFFVLSFVVGSALICGVVLLVLANRRRTKMMLAAMESAPTLEPAAVMESAPMLAPDSRPPLELKRVPVYEEPTPSPQEESAALTEPNTFPTLTAPPIIVAPPSAPASEQSLTPMQIPKEPRPFKPIVQPWKTLPPPPPRARTSSRPSMSAVDPRAASLPNRLPPPGVSANVAAKNFLSMPAAPDTVPSLPDDAPTEMMNALTAKDLENVQLG